MLAQTRGSNALALFFKHVPGVEGPVFGVKLKETGVRVPVVLSWPETKRVLEAMEVQGRRRFTFMSRWGCTGWA